ASPGRSQRISAGFVRRATPPRWVRRALVRASTDRKRGKMAAFVRWHTSCLEGLPKGDSSWLDAALLAAPRSSLALRSRPSLLHPKATERDRSRVHCHVPLNPPPNLPAKNDRW